MAALRLDVWSRNLVERVEPEALRLGCKDLADVLVGGEAAQGLEPSGEVVGGEEVAQVPPNWSWVS